MSLFNFSFPRPSLLSFRTFLPSFLTLPFQKGKVRKEGRKVVTVFLTLPFWKGKVRKEGRKVWKTEERKVKQRHKYSFFDFSSSSSPSNHQLLSIPYAFIYKLMPLLHAVYDFWHIGIPYPMKQFESIVSIVKAVCKLPTIKWKVNI